MQTEYIRVGGRLVSLASDEGKELMKWERPANYNPDAPENQFPRMLYMANRRPDGVISVNEVSDVIFGGQMGAADAFNRQCQMIVGKATQTREQNERELAVALELGWRKTQAEAIARFEAKDEVRSTEAAHRAYDDRNMGEAAKAEAAAVEAASDEHVAEIPEKPRQKRKYTRRATA